MPISDLLETALSKCGYHCTCTYDGIEAANIIEKESFDLILLDIMLPGADGFELMEYIRPTGTPVIFITAKNALNDRVKGLRMGAEDYIVKPFEMLELQARVDGVLRRHGLVPVLHRPPAVPVPAAVSVHVLDHSAGAGKRRRSAPERQGEFQTVPARNAVHSRLIYRSSSEDG